MFGNRQKQNNGVEAAQNADVLAMPERGAARQSIGTLMAEMYRRHPGGMLSPEATHQLYKDVVPEKLSGISPETLRRLAFGAAFMAEEQIRRGTPYARMGAAALTQHFALHTLRQHLEAKQRATA